jgi:pimeloyl-CoA synthetase
LYEEPKGLLGSAALLCNSDLVPQVMEIRKHVTNGKIVESVEQGKHLDDFKNKGWRIEHGENPQQSRIVMTHGARKPEWKSAFKRNFH